MRVQLVILGLLLGACSFAHTDGAEESRPDTVVGVGATVIYPGQPGPAVGPRMPSSSSQQQSGTSGPGATSSRGSSSGSPQSPAGEEMTMIGGAAAERSEKRKVRDTPLGPLTALFGYPFWIFG